jgi:hypothetical protein
MPEPGSPGGVDDKGRKKPIYFAFEIAAIRVADYGETECEYFTFATCRRGLFGNSTGFIPIGNVLAWTPCSE